MRRAIFLSLTTLSLASASILVAASSTYANEQDGRDPSSTEESSATDEEILARGEYLVRRVANCHECHTRRDPDGELILSELLLGAPVPVPRPTFAETWGLRAPAIAGLPGYTDEQAIRLLTRGLTARGTYPKPPMPRFRLKEEDARAIIAYLRSL